jgi:DNA-binding CsgD family transcriptional regulator
MHLEGGVRRRRAVSRGDNGARPLDYREAMHESSQLVRLMGVAVGFLTSVVSTRAAVFQRVDARGQPGRPAVVRLDPGAEAPRAEEVVAAVEVGYRDLAPFSLSLHGLSNATVLDVEDLGGAEAFAATRYGRDHLRPLRLATQTTLLLRDELRLVGVISLLRGLDQPPLTRAQRTLLRLSHGLVEQAFTASGEMARIERGDDPLRSHDLTEREIEVAKLAGAGATNCEIAQQLQLSQATVKTHLNRAYMKLGVRSRTQLSLLIVGARR